MKKAPSTTFDLVSLAMETFEVFQIYMIRLKEHSAKIKSEVKENIHD